MIVEFLLEETLPWLVSSFEVSVRSLADLMRAESLLLMLLFEVMVRLRLE